MPLLRIQNLAAGNENEAQKGASLPDTALWLPTFVMGNPSQRADQEHAMPKITYENSTAFGKITITDISLDGWNPTKQLLYNASSRIDAYKESIGINTFKKDEAEKLFQSGVFAGE